MKVISEQENSSKRLKCFQNPKIAFAFALTVFLFLNLTLAAPSQIVMISSVYASSNNGESDESGQEESTRDGNDPSQNEEQQDTRVDPSSSLPLTGATSEQESQCSSDAVDELTFIDENGCPRSCLSLDNSDNNSLPPECINSSESLQNLDNENSVDSSQGFANLDTNNPSNLRTLSKDTGIQGQITDDVILSANAYLNINIQKSSNLPTTEQNEHGFCVSTENEQGKKMQADPECTTLIVSSQSFTLQAPGQIIFDTFGTNFSKGEILVDFIPCQFSVEPGDEKSCSLNFRQKDLETLPSSNLNPVTGPTKEIGNNCSDGIDNDADGKTDAQNDEDCKKEANGCAGVSYYACAEICEDGVDNDGDGVTDMQDLGPNAPRDKFSGKSCWSEKTGPFSSGCFGLGPSVRVLGCVEICNDLVDNDGNGKIDGNPCNRDPLNPSGSVLKSNLPLNLGG